MRLCLQISEKRDETIKCECGRQSSGLEGGPSDVILQENGSFCFVFEALVLTIIEKDDEGASERLASFYV